MADESEMSCVQDPNFAVICSFLDNFAIKCNIDHPPFLELEEMIANTEEVATPLIELHVQLLRRMKKHVDKNRWERACIVFCYRNLNSCDGMDLETLGYMKSPVALKLRLLKNLMEGQFDSNENFKTYVRVLEANKLRLKPTGRDASDRTYWHLLDNENNLYVYREDRNHKNWEIVSRDRDGLVKLISELSPNKGDDNEDDKPCANSGDSTETASSAEDEPVETDKSEPEFAECMPGFYEPEDCVDADMNEFDESFVESDKSGDTDFDVFAESDKESDASD